MLLLTTVFSIAITTMPVLAKGPTNGNNVVYLDPSGPKQWWCIFSKIGWRQWQDTDGDGLVDRFAIVLYTEGMNPKAIEAKLTKGGWSGPHTMTSGDVRYPYTGPAEIIWKYHDIPAGSPP